MPSVYLKPFVLRRMDVFSTVVQESLYLLTEILYKTAHTLAMCKLLNEILNTDTINFAQNLACLSAWLC